VAAMRYEADAARGKALMAKIESALNRAASAGFARDDQRAWNVLPNAASEKCTRMLGNEYSG
jgi:hypothetical protein